MIEKHTKEFQGAEGPVFITVNQLNGMKGATLFFKLAKKVLPAAMSGKLDNGQRMAAMTSAVESLTVEEFEAYTKELLNGQIVVRIPSQDAVDSDAFSKLGQIFRGQPMEIFKLIMFALEVNFASFLKGGQTPAQGS